jgi:DNA-binding CsgD family transcriptional regulator
MESKEDVLRDSRRPSVPLPAGLPVQRRWSPEEVEVLRELAGSRSMPLVAKSLGRTPKAVRSKLLKVGGPVENLHGFKSKDLLNLLHVTARQIRRWRERGYLETAAGRITERSFQRFCREHPEKIPYGTLDRTTQFWLRSLGYPVL